MQSKTKIKSIQNASRACDKQLVVNSVFWIGVITASKTDIDKTRTKCGGILLELCFSVCLSCTINMLCPGIGRQLHLDRVMDKSSLP